MALLRPVDRVFWICTGLILALNLGLALWPPQVAAREAELMRVDGYAAMELAVRWIALANSALAAGMLVSMRLGVWLAPAPCAEDAQWLIVPSGGAERLRWIAVVALTVIGWCIGMLLLGLHLMMMAGMVPILDDQSELDGLIRLLATAMAIAVVLLVVIRWLVRWISGQSGLVRAISMLWTVRRERRAG